MMIRYKIKMALFTAYYYSIEFILKLRKIAGNKRITLILIFITSPYILLRWVFCGIYEKTVGKKKIIKFRNNDDRIKFKNELSVVAIMKDERQYIREWIEFHKSLGVTCFYLYDNGSTDGTRDEIIDFIESGLVVYKSFPGENMQLKAYDYAIAEHKSETRFMAVIDLDEYIVPFKDEDLVSTIKRIFCKRNEAGGIGVNWALYGSSGIVNNQNGLVTQTFLRRGCETAWPNYHVKTICNPRLVRKFISPHFPIYKLGAINISPNGKRQYVWGNRFPDYSELRCNHYFCKSKEEWLIKQERGMADRQDKYNLGKFDEYDLNDIYDDIMLRYSRIFND